MRRGTKVLSMAVLTVLIAVNLLLLFLLFRPHGTVTAQPADEGRGDDATPTLTPATGQRPSTSTEQSASAIDTNPKDSTGSTRQIEAAPAGRLLFAVSSKEAWRATVGDCDTPGKIERSSDGGASWERLVRTGSGPIVRLGQEQGGKIFTVSGTGPSCKVPYVAYLDGDRVTDSANDPIGVWYPTPNDRDEVNGPEGTKTRPCEQHAVGLAALDLYQALIVCSDGAVKSTPDSGKTWRELRRFPNTLAVTTGDGRYWLAGIDNNCNGIAVRSLRVKGGKSSSASKGCISVHDATTGEIAIDVSGNAIWVWAGSQVQISTDEGRTWT
jgi:hypothetical protein